VALINCPECGHQVSDQAAACPQCAYPLSRRAQPRTTAPLSVPEPVPEPITESMPVAAPVPAAQPTVPPGKISCPHCGTGVVKDAVYCFACGKNPQEAPRSTPQAAPGVGASAQSTPTAPVPGTVLYGNAPTPTSRAGCWRLIGIGAVILLALGIVSILLLPKFSPTADTPTPSSIAQVVQGAQPAAVQPTVVPAAAKTTDAPKPTASPPPVAAKPTALPATAKPAVPPEITSYMQFIHPKFRAVGTSMKDLGELSSAAGANTTLLRDPAWRSKMTAVLASIRVNGAQMHKYDPAPNPLKNVDDQIVSIVKDLVYISDEYATGLDQLNVNRINNATTHLVTVSQKMPRAAAEINTINSTFGLQGPEDTQNRI
jgi:hypothetical protein